MPPARSRVAVDDARSDISTTNPKDRVTSITGATKGKKNAANNLGASLSTNKTAGGSAIPNVAAVGSSTNAVDPEQDHPHIDWSTLPMQSLQNYRSTYRLQIPSAYTRPHAELLYNSCDLALRAPSRVLARRKSHDLRTYRKKLSQPTPDTRNSANGISKTTKGSRSREKERKSIKSKDKLNASDETASVHEQIDGPPSPNSHPSQHESNSTSADNASRVSRTASEDPQEDEVDIIPVTLNQANPEATVIGSTSATILSTSIRKHFNAQQLNEPETIARFSYVVRQLGSTTSSRTQPLAQRSGPLPLTTAELIANTAARAAQAASDAANGSIPITLTSAAGLGITTATATAPTKSTTNTAYSLSAPRTLAGNHLEVEGSYGDGRGWIMGTTSCGRQVRMPDSVGGGGTFRLRFRPAPWGQEVVGNRTGT